VEYFAEQGFAALRAFGMQDVAERGDVVAAAEMDISEISRDVRIAVGETELGGGFLRDFEDAWPIDGGHRDVRGFLGEGDAPDAGAGREIEHTDGRGCGGDAERFGGCAGGAVI